MNGAPLGSGRPVSPVWHQARHVGALLGSLREVPRMFVLGALLAACAQGTEPSRLVHFTMRLGVDSAMTYAGAAMAGDSLLVAKPGEVTRCVELDVALPVDVYAWRENVRYVAPISHSDIVVTIQRGAVVWHKVAGPCSQVAAKVAP